MDIDAFLKGEEGAVRLVGPDQGTRPRALLPGSFNPLHAGHRGLAAAAAKVLGCPVEFELSIVNVDKPPLDAAEVARRASQFTPPESLWVTRAPTFLQKAELFPGTWWVVGADTALRIVQGRYYADEQGVAQALEAIRERGCRFLVAGRLGHSGYQCLPDLPIPPDASDLFEALPEEAFRVDLSSTELRARRAE
ncbi:MAG: hypothetical protein U0840_14160 [Gemmataceae bacterium]